MPHDKLPEQKLQDAYEILADVSEDLPETANADGDPTMELARAQNAISRVKTDIVRWREFVDDAEVLD
jgi:hypothetical protein